MNVRVALTALFLFILPLPCPSAPKTSPDPPRHPEEDLRYQVELGSPASLGRAAALLQERDAGLERNRSFNAAGAAILTTVYPDTLALSFYPDVQSHSYSRILEGVRGGTYVSPSSRSRDFLEYVLPFLAYYGAESAGRNLPGQTPLRAALADLDKAAQLNPASVLPGLFRGFVYEKTGDLPRAETAYKKALENGDCYPAETGIARVLVRQNKKDEALALLEKLGSAYPANLELKKMRARIYREHRDWPRAGSLAADILRQDSRNGEFLLLRAQVLLEQGQFHQAAAPLDAYAALDPAAPPGAASPEGRRYLFLRARILAEGSRGQSRTGALDMLRPLISAAPEEGDIALYAAALLLESPREEERAEGRTILDQLLRSPQAGPETLTLALKDEIRRENWKGAKACLDRLLPRRREDGDLLDAWRVERELGNYAAALSHARELYGRNPSGEEAAAAYITALTDTGRNSEASRIIEQRLAAVSGGPHKSRYYYLRSKIRTSEDAVLNDLRAALFEDPRNLDALIAIFDIYHRRGDEKRAAYYLRQALSIAPGNPHLKQYEAQYGPLLHN
ncbi:MAG: tetratricopeptide repeat protein [Treponema sp.]|nr:tetratricopeptide repeat protein [Treponema sp.]